MDQRHEETKEETKEEPNNTNVNSVVVPPSESNAIPKKINDSIQNQNVRA